MRTLSLLAVVAVFLGGCSAGHSFRSPGTGDFIEVVSLVELEGTYANTADASSNVVTPRLSTFIWPRDEELEHHRIQEIVVRALGDSVLVVRGISEAETLRQSRFRKGHDFDLQSGQIHLKPVREAVGLDDDEPWVSASSETVILGIDEHGAGKLQSKRREVGLLLFVFPFTDSWQNEYRFARTGGPGD